MAVEEKSVVVHHCFLGRQVTDGDPSELIPNNRYVFVGGTNADQYKMLPTKCRCRKKISGQEAQSAWANGSAEEVFKRKDGKTIPVRDDRGFPLAIYCRFWTDAKAKIMRIDMVTRADVERAYINLVEESRILIEEIHLMQMKSRAELIVPFRPDPFEGRALFSFSPDERTRGGYAQNKGIIYLTSPRNERSCMAKFRKKPVVIDAVQWTGNNWQDIYDFTKDSDGLSLVTGPHPQIEDYGRVGDKSCVTVETSEGVMTARQNDWIIRGVKGEFYPCKPDIFEATYESA